MTVDHGRWPFFDKDTLPLKRLDRSRRADRARRSSVRDGAYLGRGRHLHAADVHQHRRLRGRRVADRLARAGRIVRAGRPRVHVSAAAQIGGVLEPVGALPVIVEDDVLIGGNCGVYEGRGRSSARGARVGHHPHRVDPDLRPAERTHHRAGPGRAARRSRRRRGRPGIASDHIRAWEGLGLSVATPIIVKYRDEKTSARTALEEWIR